MGELILIVEDEVDLATTLDYNLRQAGFQTRVAHNAADALLLAAKTPTPDLVLLDVMLPDLSGIEVCRALRADKRTRDVRIVMLTAKGEEIDRVVGFEMGADDYVVKPYSVRELLLRVRAILRRRAGDDTSEGPVVFGVLRVDSSAHRVWVGDSEVELTALEFRLLSTLLSRRGRVQSREVLLRDVWDMNAEVTTRTVDTHVKRVRQKLGNEAGAYIETLRGVGYRMRSTVGEDES